MNGPGISARAVAAVWLLTLSACAPRNYPTVQFVVPSGFRGIVCVTESPNGRAVEATNDRFVVEVPATGVLIVRSAQFFTAWHEESWRFSDGTAIPDESAPSTGADEIVAIGLGSRSINNGPFIFGSAIGTRADAPKLRREWGEDALYHRVRTAADAR